jgi:hypothetical protein
LRDDQIRERNDLNPADEIDSVVRDQSMFGETDRDRGIGHDAIRIAFPGVAIEARRQIDREDKSFFFAPEAIDLLGGCAHRFPQEMFRTEAKETIENYQMWQGP